VKIIKFFKKLVTYSINLIPFYISRLIPKDENLWIFGSWFGEKYSDNTKYLFEYVNKYHPEIKAIWLTKNKETLNLVRSKGYKAYLSYSIKGYLYSAKAKYSFITTSFSDINTFIPTTIIVNLWHGIPLKKIGYDDNYNTNFHSGSMLKFIKKKVFPFIKEFQDFDYIIASSKEDAKNMSSAFKKNLNNILIVGLPRNDVFFYAKSERNSVIKKIIYMPTHRKDSENYKIFKLLEASNDIIFDFLKKNNMDFYLKLHFYSTEFCNLESKYPNIKIIKDCEIEQDIYTIINQFDILITDYSSIYFDFLLADKPIIFAPFDYEEYITKDRELYYNYNEVTPGPKCRNWDEVLDWIVKFKENPKLFKEEREKIKKMFHKYQDGKNCERVFNEILNLDKNDKKQKVK